MVTLAAAVEVPSVVFADLSTTAVGLVSEEKLNPVGFVDEAAPSLPALSDTGFELPKALPILSELPAAGENENPLDAAPAAPKEDVLDSVENGLNPGTEVGALLLSTAVSFFCVVEAKALVALGTGVKEKEEVEP